MKKSIKPLAARGLCIPPLKVSNTWPAYDVQQFFGEMGYIEETHIARAWRDSPEVMKEILSKMSGFWAEGDRFKSSLLVSCPSPLLAPFFFGENSPKVGLLRFRGAPAVCG